MIGDWLTQNTPISDICAFARRVHRDHEFEGFEGDEEFIKSSMTKRAYSLLRDAIATMYHKRLEGFKGPNNDVYRYRLYRATEFAYRQAFALDPRNPELANRFVIFLISSRRLSDAMLINSTALLLNPTDPLLMENQRKLKPLNADRSKLITVPLKAEIPVLKRKLAENPEDWTTGKKLLDNYRTLKDREGILETLNVLSRHPKIQLPVMVGLFQIYQPVRDTEQLRPLALRMLDAAGEVKKKDKAEHNELLLAGQAYSYVGLISETEALYTRATKEHPDNPQSWLVLAAIQSHRKKTDESIKSLTKAFDLSKKHKSGPNSTAALRLRALRNPAFHSLADNPKYKQLTRRK